MQVEIPMAKVYGRKPKHVEALLAKRGIDVSLPYLVKLTFETILVEQPAPRHD